MLKLPSQALVVVVVVVLVALILVLLLPGSVPVPGSESVRPQKNTLRGHSKSQAGFDPQGKKLRASVPAS